MGTWGLALYSNFQSGGEGGDYAHESPLHLVPARIFLFRRPYTQTVNKRKFMQASSSLRPEEPFILATLELKFRILTYWTIKNLTTIGGRWYFR